MPAPDNSELSLTSSDIYLAAQQGVLLQADAERLVRYLGFATRKWISVIVGGALGIFLYLGHLAYEVFKNSLFFPFVVALLGLGLIVLTVWMQRRILARASV